jgi:hypothetical protein
MITPPPRRAPRWITAAGGLLAALLLLEVTARIEGPTVCAGASDVLLQSDPDVEWTYTPGLAATLDACDAGNAWRAPLSVNRHGLPDQDWPYEKRPGEVRVLLLGDQLADGGGLAREDRLSVRLSHLADRVRGARVSAINAMIAGYTTRNQLLWLQRRGLRYSPDVIVLLVHPTRDLAASLAPAVARPIASSLPPASGLLDLSGGVRWLRGRPASAPTRTVAIDEPPAIENDADRALALEQLRARIEQVADVSRSAGAGFAVLIAPPCPPESQKVDLCAALEGVAPCLDLAPSFADLRSADD